MLYCLSVNHSRLSWPSARATSSMCSVIWMMMASIMWVHLSMLNVWKSSHGSSAWWEFVMFQGDLNGQKGLVPSNFLQAFPETQEEAVRPEHTATESRRDSQVRVCAGFHVTRCMNVSIIGLFIVFVLHVVLCVLFLSLYVYFICLAWCSEAQERSSF